LRTTRLIEQTNDYAKDIVYEHLQKFVKALLCSVFLHPSLLSDVKILVLVSAIGGSA
jgi:hypothetical protein